MMALCKASSAMRSWFSNITEAAFRCKKVVSTWVSASIVIGLFMKAMDRVLFAAFTCIMALGGCMMGTIVGAIRGQTTEAGFLDGAGKGAVTGAIAALELLELVAYDEPFSKVALLGSLLNGKVFMECVISAVAQAYQLHMPESTHRVVSDVYDIRGAAGLSINLIQKLPADQYNSSTVLKIYHDSCCSICLQDFEDGELVRILPRCTHCFHMECIDKWLIQQGSCPMCRTCVHEL